MAMLTAAPNNAGLIEPARLGLERHLKVFSHLQRLNYARLTNATRCLVLVVCGGVGAMAQADIYQWTDASGKVHYTDRPDDSAVAKSGDTVTKIETKVNTFEPLAGAGPEAQPAAKTVEMYATKWCGYCKKARRYMAKKGIAYIEYDIEADAAANARHKALGGRGVPLILVDGRRLNGFSESGFERVYNPK